MTTEPLDTRRLPLPGTFNLRDVGGYPAHGGRTVRRGALYRSDGLHALGVRGLDALAELGVGAVIDLRRDDELQRAPDPVATDARFAYHHIPLTLTPGALREPPADLTHLYLAYLDHSQGSFRDVMAAIAATPPDRAVLVHCTAGKDRTGLVVALGLLVAGVPPDVVVADYALSGPLLRPLLPALRLAPAGEGREAAALEPLLRCEPEFMTSALAHIDARWGSPASYLLATGLSAADLERVRARLLGE